MTNMSFSFKKLSLYIRKKRDAVLKFIIRKNNVDPDLITLFSLLISIPTAYFFLINSIILSGISLFIVVLLDIIDGFSARSTKKSSEIGLTIDYSVDRMSEAVIKIGIVFGGFTNSILALLSLFGNTLVTFFVAEGERHHIKMNYITPFPTRLLILAVITLSPFFEINSMINIAFLTELVITSIMCFYALHKILLARMTKG